METNIKDVSNYKLSTYIGCSHCDEQDTEKALNKRYDLLETYLTKTNLEIKDELDKENEEALTEDRLCKDCNKKYSVEIIIPKRSF